MKVVVIGDIHGRDIWKKIIKKEKPQKVIFMGDYFDSYKKISSGRELRNFEQIIIFKQETDIEVVTLYGNHEHHYMQDDQIYSGFQSNAASYFKEAIQKAIAEDLLQIAHVHDDLLFTHAGVSTVWLEDHLPHTTLDTLVRDLNISLRSNPKIYDFVGWSGSGDTRDASPIWIRQVSLLQSNKKEPIKKRFRQIVGHSEVKMDLETFKKYLGERYIMVDALAEKQYLIYENQQFRVGQITEEDHN